MAVAPGRALRPGASSPPADELDSCPFCAGREERTPPETFRIGDPWRVRVVPNLYPALERHEVVVHTPEHLRSIAELTDEQLELVAEAWRIRAAAARAEGFHYVHALVNEGRPAGASLPHTHSQLVWLRETPPAALAERDLSRLLEGEVVVEHGGLVLLCPHASRVPYEMLVAPAASQDGAFESPLLAPALAVVAEGVRKLRALEPEVPLNVWLHDAGWWHLEVVPRLTVFAGLELGAGIYVNPLPPEEAARALRA